MSLFFCLFCNFFVYNISMQWREWPSGFVCFKILSFCLFCNFYVFFSVHSGSGHPILFVLKLCWCCFVCFWFSCFCCCCFCVCSVSVQWWEWPSGFVCFKMLSLLFGFFCNFHVFLCAVVVCSGGSGHLVIGSMALPATHRIKHPSPDLKTRKIWFPFLF